MERHLDEQVGSFNPITYTYDSTYLHARGILCTQARTFSTSREAQLNALIGWPNGAILFAIKASHLSSLPDLNLFHSVTCMPYEIWRY